MKLQLGVPGGQDAALGNRLAHLTLFRLVFLSILLAIIGRLHLRDVQLRAFSVQLALLALAVAFAMALVSAVVLRSGRWYRPLAIAQLVVDQITWTVLVYVSGGANSGATSLYGLTTLTGAILGGLPTAAFAAGIGYALYVLLSLLMVGGVLNKPPDQNDVAYAATLNEVVFALGMNLLVVIVVALLGGYLAERLRITWGKLEEATQRAERAERLAYLGKVSAALAHEIRNPLGAISASVELLGMAPGLSKDDQQLCEIIQRESTRLNDLVTDMLQLARPKKPEMGPSALGSIARDVVALASRVGRSASDVRVSYEGPARDDDVVVHADASQVRQVLWNLVRNAVQAAAPGSEVMVRVREREAAEPGFEVCDAGEGIPAEVRASLFEAFVSTRTHGSGIGLAVVKRIIDDHGWQIDVFSKEGHGSTFRVRIPPGARVERSALGAASP